MHRPPQNSTPTDPPGLSWNTSCLLASTSLGTWHMISYFITDMLISLNRVGFLWGLDTFIVTIYISSEPSVHGRQQSGPESSSLVFL
jgi:hypothetical protein